MGIFRNEVAGGRCGPRLGIQDPGGELMPALIAVVLGIVLGSAVGGSLPRLGLLTLRFELLLIPLFAVQAIARGRLLGLVGASRFSLAVWVASSILLVSVMLLNWRTPGMAIGAAGVLMNLDVVLVNRAMPVLGGGGLLASAPVAEVASRTGGFYRVVEQGDLFTWLGDVMPIAAGRSVALVSPGDVVLMIAVAVVIMFGMSTGEGRRGADPMDAA